MTDVRNVADYFLSKDAMTHKKLEKMCYYAQAWYLANYGTPLFNNRFEAWVHGPVSPDLYAKYKQWGWMPIPKGINIDMGVSPQERDILDKVYDTYGGYDGDELERLTHMEEPWQKARRGCGPLDYSRNPISMKDMRDYYGERIGRKYEQ